MDLKWQLLAELGAGPRSFWLLVWFSCAGFYLPGLVFIYEKADSAESPCRGSGKKKGAFSGTFFATAEKAIPQQGSDPRPTCLKLFVQLLGHSPGVSSRPSAALGRQGRAPAGAVGALHVALLVSPNPGVSRGSCAQFSAGLYKLWSW